jgi:hypothetical protein
MAHVVDGLCHGPGETAGEGGNLDFDGGPGASAKEEEGPAGD